MYSIHAPQHPQVGDLKTVRLRETRLSVDCSWASRPVSATIRREAKTLNNSRIAFIIISSSIESNLFLLCRKLESKNDRFWKQWAGV